ncbi:MAG: class I poly(R)-hydroxyalkanoic acid synthase, partial [Rhodocyclaceae bacterium]
YMGAQLFSGPTRFVLGGSGHIAGIINPPVANKYGYWTNAAAKLAESADDWFSGTQQNPGSWWYDWARWVTDLNGTEKVAPRDPNKGKLKVIEDAPGSYASFRLDAQKKKA